MIKVYDLDIKTREILLYSSNMTLKRSSIYGLSAKNGSGKTTLLRTISALRSEPNGSIIITENGQQLNLIQSKKALFYFETTEWFDTNLSGADYLTFTNATWNNSKTIIEEMIHFWGMNDYIKLPIKKYSLGMKQKVLLAMYGVSGADYWLLDEPTIGLDTTSMKLFETFILEAKKKGRCILFSSHHNDNVYSICDYLYEINDRTLILTTVNKKLGD